MSAETDTNKYNWQPLVANLEDGSISIWQSMIAKLDSDLQLPADKLFGCLSFTHNNLNN